MITLMEHQKQTVEFGRFNAFILDWSDPGTGKTISHLTIFKKRLDAGSSNRLLVLCPKTIMRVAWEADLLKAYPDLSYTLAYAHNREAAVRSGARVIIMNHDGINWVVKNLNRIRELGFTDLYIDESTAYKNPRAARTKAAIKSSKEFKFRHLMSGTAAMKSVQELWSQACIADGGQRLGDNFYRFRAEVTEPVVVKRGVTSWEDKPDMMPVVSVMLNDIVIRHSSDECLDLPEHTVRRIDVELDPEHLAYYRRLRDDALIELESGDVSAAQKGVLRQKLRQAAAGTVYSDTGEILTFSTERYELILQLCSERSAAVVPFIFKHQLVELKKLADRMGISYGEIHGGTNDNERQRSVNRFQDGSDSVIFIHPQSAAHGITLTAGRATIWTSPTDSAEHFVQTNHRIYRNGVRHTTETLLLQGVGTLESAIYDALDGNQANLNDLFAMLT